MGRIVRVTVMAGALALALATGLEAAASPPAEEATPAPTPTPTPRAGKATTPTPVPGSLAAAARAARRRRAGTRLSGTPIVITNENLKEYAAKGNLTYATGSTGAAEAGVEGDGGEGSEKGEKSVEKKREFWRNKYKAQKELVEKMKKRIEELDREIPGLWTQFYSWDDPAYRDGVIKPKLDKDLQERKELAQKLPQEQAKLDEILEQARRDGALPGWFRDLVD